MLVIIVGAIIMLILAGLAISALPQSPDYTRLPVWKPRHLTIVGVATVVGAIGLVVGLIGAAENDNRLWKIFVDLAPEMVGLAFTVVVIDELSERRAERLQKQNILKQMGSQVNSAAVEATRLANLNGWLIDGSLVSLGLKDANLQGAVLSKANLRLASLERADLSNTSLDYADLCGASLRRTNLKQAIMRHADLNSAILLNADLSEADLSDTNLKDAFLRNANLQETILWNADMHAADLSYANLQHAILNFANLQFAKLQGTNFQYADCGNVNFQNAIYSADTLWPSDFNPNAAGAILVEWGADVGNFVQLTG